MDIVLQSGTDVSKAEAVLMFGRNVRAGGIMEGLSPRGKRAVFIGVAADDETFENSLAAGLGCALGLCAKKGYGAVAVDVASFLAKDRREDYLANAILDALIGLPAAANVTVYVLLELRSKKAGIAKRADSAINGAIVSRVNFCMVADRERIGQKLEDHLRKNPEKSSFREELLALIERGGYRKFSEVYKRAGISKSTFSKIVNFTLDYMPSKPTVAALAIGLRLNPEDAQNLFHAAGYHLGETDLQDRIVRFFLEERIYDIHEVNCCLDRYGLPVLGEHARESNVRSEKR